MCIFIIVIQTSCTHLSVSANGRIVPCNSGEDGMRHSEDSCNFTCNTGFEMTGSDAGTCREVSGNWSDNESPCKRGMQLTTFKILSSIVFHSYLYFPVISCISQLFLVFPSYFLYS